MTPVLLILALCVAAPRPAAQPVDSAPIASTHLLGFLPDGHMLLFETLTDGRSILKRSTLEGRERILREARPGQGVAWAQRTADQLGAERPSPLPKSASGWHFLGIDFRIERDAALGGRREIRLVAAADGQAVTVWRMPVIRPVQVGPIWPARDGRTLILGYGHGGRRGLATLDARRVHAGLLNRSALQRLREGDLRGAAERLEDAVAAAPFAGDAIYNLACVHARLGQEKRARGELRIALDIDPARYRALARTDSDLEPLRTDPVVKRWLRLRD